MQDITALLKELPLPETVQTAAQERLDYMRVLHAQTTCKSIPYRRPE